MLSICVLDCFVIETWALHAITVCATIYTKYVSYTMNKNVVNVLQFIVSALWLLTQFYMARLRSAGAWSWPLFSYVSIGCAMHLAADAALRNELPILLYLAH